MITIKGVNRFINIHNSILVSILYFKILFLLSLSLPFYLCINIYIYIYLYIYIYISNVDYYLIII